MEGVLLCACVDALNRSQIHRGSYMSAPRVADIQRILHECSPCCRFIEDLT